MRRGNLKIKPKGFLPVFLLIVFMTANAQAVEFNEVTRLAALAKVWGFLKYYHPEVARGIIDWDEMLIYFIGKAESANSRGQFNQVLNLLIQNAGNVNFLNDPRPIPKKSQNDPLFRWMKDQTHFMWYTIFKMERLIESFEISSNRYCSYVFAKGNLDFSKEKSYDSPTYPDEGHRLLALFRYWNIIYYFFPYRYLIGSDWEEILGEFIPKVKNANDARAYHLAIRELTARLNDSHASTSSQVLSEYWGLYYPPFEVLHIEDRTVVTKVYTHLPASAGGLRTGDIILKADEIPVETLRRDQAIYVQASNEPTKQRNLNSLIFRGPTAHLRLGVLRDGLELSIDVIRCYYTDYKIPDQTLPVWSILAGDIGYVNMGILEVAQVDEIMAQLMNTRAIIFDIRNYPRGTLYKIATYLNPEKREFVKFTYPDL
jgi:hypothetical protein